MRIKWPPAWEKEIQSETSYSQPTMESVLQKVVLGFTGQMLKGRYAFAIIAAAVKETSG